MTVVLKKTIFILSFRMNFKGVKILFQFLFAGILFSGCAGSRIRVDGARLEKYLSDREEKQQDFCGFVLKDPESGKTIYNHHGERYFTPASNTKILTLYASKKMIGDSLPSVVTRVSEDTLFFSGTGDPTILHPGFTYQPAFDYLSAAELPIVYVPGVFNDERFGPGWAWDDYPYAYSVEKSGFPIFGNVVRIKKQPYISEPEVFPAVLGKNVQLIFDSVPGQEQVVPYPVRQEFSNRFSLVYEDYGDFIDETIPFLSNDALISELLEDTLRKEVLIGKEFPAGWPTVIYSQPTDSLLKPMMINSDNFFAEQLLIMCAWVLTDTLESGKAIDYARSNFFGKIEKDLYWVDGSGLSRYNKLTPDAVSEVLKMIYLEYGSDFIKGIFPEGGVSGTMKNNFPELKNIVWAKTGSMSHVYNLSGYLVTKKGKWLIFSFMNNNFTVPPSGIRKEITRVLLSVRNRF